MAEKKLCLHPTEQCHFQVKDKKALCASLKHSMGRTDCYLTNGTLKRLNEINQKM